MTINKIIYTVVTISLVMLWGVQLFTEWGSDFGTYYTNSYFIDDNYQLYKEAFSHKGPLYFLFISILGKVIGWGVWQAYFTLISSLLVFYLAVIYVLSKRVENTNIFIVILSISLLLLYKQGTNLSISLFQGGLLLLSFYCLMESIATIEKNRTTEYVVSISLFICAILVRIDALIYVPVYIIAIVFSSINRRSYIFFLQRIIIGIAIATVLYAAIQIYFGYSFFEYYQGNIEFNSYYKNANVNTSLQTYIVRPQQFSMLMNSGVLLLFLLILMFKHNSTVKKNENSLIKVFFTKSDIQIYITSLLIVLSGAILWLISNSDKDYYVFIVAVPILFFMIYWGEEINNISHKLMFVSAPILLYMLMLTIGTALQPVLKNNNCLNNIYCSESNILLYKKTLNNLSMKDSAMMIGGKGWLYLFANTKPEGAINNRWLYIKKDPFITRGLLEAHNKLLNQPIGYEFWIDNSLLNSNEKSDYFYEILTKSELAEHEGKYSKYRIKNK